MFGSALALTGIIVYDEYPINTEVKQSNAVFKTTFAFLILYLVAHTIAIANNINHTIAPLQKGI